MTPGWKTTEMWLSLIAIASGALLGSGLLVPQSTIAKVVGLVVTVLAALGYTASRTIVKKAALDASCVEIKPLNGNGDTQP